MDALIDEWRLSFLRSINNASVTFFRPRNQSRSKPINFTDLKFFPKFYRKTLKIRRKKKTKKFFRLRSRLIVRRLRRLRRLKFTSLISIQRTTIPFIRPADRLRYRMNVRHQPLIPLRLFLANIKEIEVEKLPTFEELIILYPNEDRFRLRKMLNEKKKQKNFLDYVLDL